MRIRIPAPVVRAADSFGDFLNIVLTRRRRLVVRVVDVIVAVLGSISVVWMYEVSGWWGALQGVLMFILAMMCAVWFF